MSARGWARGGGCGSPLKRLQSEGDTMTAKPGQTSFGADPLYWNHPHLVRITRFSQREQRVAQKLLYEPLKRLEGCSLETFLRSLCFFFSRSTALELRFRFLRSFLTLLTLTAS